jgi:hypothetical protein
VQVKKYQSSFKQGLGGSRGKFWQGGLIEGINNAEISGDTVTVPAHYVPDWIREHVAEPTT